MDEWTTREAGDPEVTNEVAWGRYGPVYFPCLVWHPVSYERYGGGDLTPLSYPVDVTVAWLGGDRTESVLPVEEVVPWTTGNRRRFRRAKAVQDLGPDERRLLGRAMQEAKYLLRMKTVRGRFQAWQAATGRPGASESEGDADAEDEASSDKDAQESPVEEVSRRGRKRKVKGFMSRAAAAQGPPKARDKAAEATRKRVRVKAVAIPAHDPTATSPASSPTGQSAGAAGEPTAQTTSKPRAKPNSKPRVRTTPKPGTPAAAAGSRRTRTAATTLATLSALPLASPSLSAPTSPPSRSSGASSAAKAPVAMLGQVTLSPLPDHDLFAPSLPQSVGQLRPRSKDQPSNSYSSDEEPRSHLAAAGLLHVHYFEDAEDAEDEDFAPPASDTDPCSDDEALLDPRAFEQERDGGYDDLGADAEGFLPQCQARSMQKGEAWDLFVLGENYAAAPGDSATVVTFLCDTVRHATASCDNLRWGWTPVAMGMLVDAAETHAAQLACEPSPVKDLICEFLYDLVNAARSMICDRHDDVGGVEPSYAPRVQHIAPWTGRAVLHSLVDSRLLENLLHLKGVRLFPNYDTCEPQGLATFVRFFKPIAPVGSGPGAQ